MFRAHCLSYVFRAEGDLDRALESFKEEERKLSEDKIKQFIETTGAEKEVATAYIERSDQQTLLLAFGRVRISNSFDCILCLTSKSQH